MAAPGTAPRQGGTAGRWLEVAYGGRTRRYLRARDGDTLWLGRDGHAWALAEALPVDAARTGARERDGAGLARG